MDIQQQIAEIERDAAERKARLRAEHERHQQEVRRLELETEAGQRRAAQEAERAAAVARWNDEQRPAIFDRLAVLASECADLQAEIAAIEFAMAEMPARIKAKRAEVEAFMDDARRQYEAVPGAGKWPVFRREMFTQHELRVRVTAIAGKRWAEVTGFSTDAQWGLTG